MPGPNSVPQAKTSSGQLITGKTALKARRLKSGQNMKYTRDENK